MEEKKYDEFWQNMRRVEYALNRLDNENDDSTQKFTSYTFGFKRQLMKSIYDVENVAQIRGYYSIDKNNQLDLTGCVNVLIYEISVESIIENMMKQAEEFGQTFICPYVGKEYHEHIIEEINRIIDENKRQNFPLL